MLVLWNPSRRQVRVGRLGRLDFPAGLYLYVGSGGANAVRRVQRHLAQAKRIRWHIDYLTTGRNRMRPVDAYFYPGVPECRLALELARGLAASPHGKTVQKQPSSLILPATWKLATGNSRLRRVPGFGSSDCHCGGHLFYAPDLASAVEAVKPAR